MLPHHGLPHQAQTKSCFPIHFQVDTFVCRDLDSRFSQREFDAVAEWLVSDKAIHSMRDHYGHLIAMLGRSIMPQIDPYLNDCLFLGYHFLPIAYCHSMY